MFMRSKNAKWVVTIAAALFGLSGSVLFAQSGAQAPQAMPSATLVSSAASAAPSGTTPAASRVRIGGGDMLEVAVFDVPEMSQTVRVSDLGDATFSLIGSVHLADLTTDQARDLISSKLREGHFILNPQVSVLIREYGTQGVSVLGEVHKPGVYPVLGNRTLLDVLSEAGGTTPFAGASATIKRYADGSMLTIALTRNAQSSLASDVQLQPGDKVLIPRANLVYVIGDVIRPGGFTMQDDGRVTALQAMAFAGGSTRTASLNHVIIVHKTGTSYSETNVSLSKIMHGKTADVELQADDIMYVPNSTAKSIVFRGLPGIVQAASTAAVYGSVP